jgi:riboflavin synthase
MFTGIIEQTARVVGTADGPKFRRLTLASPWEDLRPGESIAVNGCCLTIAELEKGQIQFDVVSETLSKTNLGLLASGDDVHVERSMRIGDRIDGHFVQGHVDGIAPLLDMTQAEHEARIVLEAPQHLAKYLVPKGSVAVDGVSLTIAAVQGNVFEIALIPTTLNLTTLGRRKIGWPYNLEADILTKTVISYLEKQTA